MFCVEQIAKHCDQTRDKDDYDVVRLLVFFAVAIFSNIRKKKTVILFDFKFNLGFACTPVYFSRTLPLTPDLFFLHQARDVMVQQSVLNIFCNFDPPCPVHNGTLKDFFSG